MKTARMAQQAIKTTFPIQLIGTKVEPATAMRKATILEDRNGFKIEEADVADKKAHLHMISAYGKLYMTAKGSKPTQRTI